MKNNSTECGTHHMPETIKVKLTCDIPHFCQFIPIQAWLLNKSHLISHLIIYMLSFRNSI